jgi:hypothetical protein
MGDMICGLHAYIGPSPCPNCAQPQPGSPASEGRPPVVLNGQRIRFEIRTKSKPCWIPLFLWNRLCSFVVRRVQIVAKDNP